MTENIVKLALEEVVQPQIAMEGFFDDLSKTIKGWKDKLLGSPEEVDQAVKEQIAKINAIEKGLKQLKTQISGAKIDKSAVMKIGGVLQTLGLVSNGSSSNFIAALEADFNNSTAQAKKALALAQKLASGKQVSDKEIEEAKAVKAKAATKPKTLPANAEVSFTKADLLRLVDAGLKACSAQKAVLQTANAGAVKKSVDAAKGVAMEALTLEDAPHLAQELWNAVVEIFKHVMTALLIIIKLLWIGTKVVASAIARGISALFGAIDDVLN